MTQHGSCRMLVAFVNLFLSPSQHLYLLLAWICFFIVLISIGPSFSDDPLPYEMSKHDQKYHGLVEM